MTMTRRSTYSRRETIKGDRLIVEQYKAIRSSGGSTRRNKNRKESSPAQKKRNQIRAEQRCKDLLNLNVSKGDLFLTLTFSEVVEKTTAEHEFKTLRRRVKNDAINLGLGEFKYIGVVEKENGGRYCIHMVVEKRFLKVIVEQWGARGFTKAKILGDKFESVATYIRKELKKGERPKQSHNLVKPEVIVSEMNIDEIADYLAGVVPSVPNGYELFSVREFEGLDFQPHRIFEYKYVAEDSC